jgi:uncharacterized repeat protein (TIGR01451 family)
VLVKDDCRTSVAAGGSYVFTFTIQNAGTVAASNVQLVDTFPSVYSIVSVPSGCSTLSGVLSCSWPTLAAGAEVSVTVGYTMTTGVAVGTFVVNCAAVSSAESDANAFNNEDCDTNTVVAAWFARHTAVFVSPLETAACHCSVCATPAHAMERRRCSDVRFAGERVWTLSGEDIEVFWSFICVPPLCQPVLEEYILSIIDTP